MKLKNIDPEAYRKGWERSQKEFERFLKSEYEQKRKLAIEKLRKGEVFGQIIEAA